MGKTILIVEDEQNIVDILSFNLSREGYDTLEAYDGPTGLQLALESNPDLILLDLMLPGMNGFDMGMQFRAHADKLGVEFRETEVLSLSERNGMKIVKTDAEELEAKTVILATGAVHARLGVPGEEELSGMGVSYCATCDGAFFRGKTVAVIGGGDVALEDALFLARACEKVYLIHRRDEFRGAKVLVEAVKKQENIEIIWDTIVERINGADQVESLSLYNRKKDKRFNQGTELQNHRSY